MDLASGSAFWRFALAVGGLLVWLVLENVWAFRLPVQSRLSRYGINLSIAGANAFLLSTLFGSLLLTWSGQVMMAHTGLFNLVGLGGEANVVASVVVMDLVLYGVHRANHAVPVLWRFHRAHHSDLDLDVTTASRFHPGEVLISAGIKLPAIWALGVSPLGLVSFEIGLLAAAQFQHSNLRVPEPYETIVRRVLVTPNMHRVHHSTVFVEHESNFSTIFSVWDRLFGTYHMKVRQEGIRIGLSEYQDLRAVSLPRVMWMPFTARCSLTGPENPVS
ncbi:MAG: sterol desaturase family protein [Nitrospirae bacterium]|nr:sterol desaturase family protein [Nitrospirota bacterium]